MDDIFENLCWYDPRHPNYIPDPGAGDYAPPKPRDGCACDSCFYGRDALALRILAMRADRDAEERIVAAAAAYVAATDAREACDPDDAADLQHLMTVETNAYRDLVALLRKGGAL